MVPKSIRQTLEAAEEQLRGVPSKIRSYEAYEKTKEKLSSLKKLNLFIAELKTESVKPRHWK